MSRAEDVLYLSLTDVDRLEKLALIGLPDEAIPNTLMRPVVKWALDEFYRSGRKTAPTREALVESWGTTIDDARVELLPEDEDADTTEWAIERLKAQFVWAKYQEYVKDSVSELSQAAELDRVPLLGRITDALNELNMSLQSRQHHMNIKDGMTEALHAYEARSDPNYVRSGMRFGIPEIDQHTNGIYPGEIAVLAAGPKTGKSWFIGYSALSEWDRGRSVVLYTLENSVEMTYDRLACMYTGIPYRDWQRGTCTQSQVERIRSFVHDEVLGGDGKGRLEVIMPSGGDRTMQAMVRRAHTLGAQSLLIDQLTFVEHPQATTQRLQRDQIIGAMMHELKELISTGSEPLPVLLAHQINREGVKAAKKVGYLSMENMAEGSEVERTADWAFGLYQSSMQRQAGEAMLQILATRREDVNAWDINWEPAMGLVGVIKESEIEF